MWRSDEVASDLFSLLRPSSCECVKKKKKSSQMENQTQKQTTLLNFFFFSHFAYSFWVAWVFFFLREKKKQLHDIRSGNHYCQTAFWHLTPALPLSASGFWTQIKQKTPQRDGDGLVIIMNFTCVFIYHRLLDLLLQAGETQQQHRCEWMLSFPWTNIYSVKHCDYLSLVNCVSPGTDEVESPRVVNVILPEQRSYFVQHLGYFLATLLLLAIIVAVVVVLTRRRKKRGLYLY